MNKPTKYTEVNIKKLPKSQVEITGTIDYSIVATYKDKALTRLNESVTIDGFRKGKVPQSVLTQKIGSMAILEEMAEFALSAAYPAIIIDHKLDPIGRPAVAIKKLAENNPLEFTITTAVSPTVKLADYKSIAKEINSAKEEPIEVTDKEMNDVIDQIRAGQIDHSGHDHDKMTKEEHDEFMKKSMPELTDEFVKSISKFAGVEEFKAKVKENVLAEKQNRARSLKRSKIIDAVIKSSEIEMPEILVENELRRMEEQFTQDVENVGVKMSDYLSHIKKTIDDLRKDWREDAERKAKTQIILNEISNKESIKLDPKQIEEEVIALEAKYKDADRERLEVFVATMFTNEKVLELLEAQK